MLSVVIPVPAPEPALIDTLAALVPAAADGLVRDLVLAVPVASDFVRDVADAAGCGLVTVGDGDRDRLLAAGAAESKGPWLLTLQPGLVPGGDWMAEVRDFLDACEPDGSDAAVFSLASRGPFRSRMRCRWSNLAASLAGWAHPLQGMVAPATRLARRDAKLRITLLSSPVYDRRGRSRGP